jgi:hypothetical protein
MILGGSGAYVCTVQIEQRGGGIIAKAMEPERRANAALIVRCVNSYEIMKAALEEIAGDPTDLSSYQADLAQAALSTIQKAPEYEGRLSWRPLSLPTVFFAQGPSDADCLVPPIQQRTHWVFCRTWLQYPSISRLV